MFKHSLKSRTARLALGVLIATSSTAALIGAGTGPAAAATLKTPTIDRASNAAEYPQVKAWSAINVAGSTSPGATVIVIVTDNTSGIPYGADGVATKYGGYRVTTPELPASACGHTLSAQTHSVGSGQVKVSAVTSLKLNCGPQYRYIKTSDGEIRIYGTRFTPGGKVTQTTRSFYGVLTTKYVTARSTGNLDSLPIYNCMRFFANDQTTGRTTGWVTPTCIL